MVVGSALSLIDVDNAVQVGEVAIQVDSLGIAAAHEPVLDLPGLCKTQELRVSHSGKRRGKHLSAVQSPEKRLSQSHLGSWRA